MKKGIKIFTLVVILLAILTTSYIIAFVKSGDDYIDDIKYGYLGATGITINSLVSKNFDNIKYKYIRSKGANIVEADCISLTHKDIIQFKFSSEYSFDIVYIKEDDIVLKNQFEALTYIENLFRIYQSKMPKQKINYDSNLMHGNTKINQR